MILLFFVVTYDIPDDKRRTKIAGCLEDYGRRVQYSVFEVETGKDDFEQMRSKLREIIEPGEDQVRYYFLCGSCVEKIEVDGVPGDGGWDDVIVI